jgi:hypothetical protein
VKDRATFGRAPSGIHRSDIRRTDKRVKSVYSLSLIRFACRRNDPMGEYPSTRLDKAVLKFAPQGRKKSQNVSATISLFFLLLFGNYCRIGVRFMGDAGRVVSIFAAFLSARRSAHLRVTHPVRAIGLAHL